MSIMCKTNRLCVAGSNSKVGAARTHGRTVTELNDGGTVALDRSPDTDERNYRRVSEMPSLTWNVLHRLPQSLCLVGVVRCLDPWIVTSWS